MKHIFFLISLFPLLFLSAYANPDQSKTLPHQQLSIQDYFKGNQEGYGLVFNRDGKSVMSFKKSVRGNWRDDQGYLTEIIQYANGEKNYHEWCVHLIDANHFAAVSTAASGMLEGEQSDGVIHLRYHPIESSDLAYSLIAPQGNGQQDQASQQYHRVIDHLNQWYDAITSFSTVNKKQHQNKPLTYQVGPVCEKMIKEWKLSQEQAHQNMTTEVWLYSVTPQVVLSKTIMMKNNKKIGESITAFSL